MSNRSHSPRLLQKALAERSVGRKNWLHRRPRIGSDDFAAGGSIMRFNLTVVAAIVIALSSPAFPQAGSAGGTIGKQGKSASGEETAKPAPAAEPKRKRTPKRASTAPRTASVGSLVGRWRWEASCSDGPGGGIFHLHQSPSGGFVGEFGNTNYWDRGTISGGALEGNRVTFVSYYTISRTWTATLSGSRMQGSFTGPGDCKFSASKN